LGEGESQRTRACFPASFVEPELLILFMILNDKNGDIEQGCQGNQQELPFPLSSYIRKLMFPTASHQYLTQMQHHVSSRNRLMAISEPWHVTNPWRLH